MPLKWITAENGLTSLVSRSPHISSLYLGNCRTDSQELINLACLLPSLTHLTLAPDHRMCGEPLDSFISRLVHRSTNQSVLLPRLTRFAMCTTNAFNCELFVQIIKSRQNPPEPLAVLELASLQLSQRFAPEIVVELQETGMITLETNKISHSTLKPKNPRGSVPFSSSWDC